MSLLGKADFLLTEEEASEVRTEVCRGETARAVHRHRLAYQCAVYLSELCWEGEAGCRGLSGL